MRSIAILFASVNVVFLYAACNMAVAQSGTRTAVPAQSFPQSQSYAQPATRGMVQGSSTRGAVPSGQAVYGASGGYETVTQGATSAKAPFESQFWDYLRKSQYRNWAPAPGQDGGAYEGQSPHGAYLKMYLNRTAIAKPSELPFGSIVIKENYGQDQRTLMAITVMYRTKSYNREGGGWYWVKYKPTGEVDVKSTDAGSMRLAGKVKGCIECHEGADGNDFAFFNDGP
jgi:hypothetical protein